MPASCSMPKELEVLPIEKARSSSLDGRSGVSANEKRGGACGRSCRSELGGRGWRSAVGVRSSMLLLRAPLVFGSSPSSSTSSSSLSSFSLSRATALRRWFWNACAKPVAETDNSSAAPTRPLAPYAFDLRALTCVRGPFLRFRVPPEVMVVTTDCSMTEPAFELRRPERRGVGPPKPPICDDMADGWMPSDPEIVFWGWYRELQVVGDRVGVAIEVKAGAQLRVG
jgi:hypothetical protein